MSLTNTSWRRVLRQFGVELKIQNTSKLNGILFFLRKIPVIGKKIPVSLYSDYALKQVLFWLFFIGNVLFRIVVNTALLFALTFFASEAFKELTLISVPQRPDFGTGLIAWIYIWAVCGGFLMGVSNQLGRKDMEFVQQFFLSPREYLKNTTVLQRVFAAVLYLPPLFAYVLITKRYLLALSGLLCFLLCYVFGMVWNRKLYQWRFEHKKLLLVVYLSVLTAGGLGILFIGSYWTESVLANPLTVLGLLVLSALCLRSLFSFKDESGYLLQQIDQSNQALANMAKAKNKQYLSVGLTMQKELDVTRNNGTPLRYKGNQYLNALLFHRYRPQLIRGMRYRIFFLLACLVASSVAGVFSRGQIDVKTAVAGGTAALSYLFLIFYMLGYGKKIAQMVFINCDIAMLYYPFYREPKTIVSGFLYRFMMTVRYNLVIALGIGLVFLSYGIIAGNVFTLPFYGVLLLLLAALVLLFSFHELFIYYLLQPFTSDMEVVNPLYRVVSGALYWLSYLNMQLHIKSLFYSLAISAVVFLYVGVGLAVIYKKAPQTFRIK